VGTEKAVIAVDLHGVVFDHDYKKMWRLFLQDPRKAKLVFALLNPFLWADLIRLTKKGAVAQEFLIDLAEKYCHLKPFIPLNIEIANQQKPKWDVIALLKKLKNKGYQLHLFSNIGSIFFEDLHRKFPEIINLFESFTIPSTQNGYLRKPDPIVFKKFLKTHAQKKQPVILIDDKTKNTRAAEQLGITSIFFRSADQLERELISNGIIL